MVSNEAQTGCLLGVCYPPLNPNLYLSGHFATLEYYVVQRHLFKLFQINLVCVSA